ncbi:C-type lectin domain family 4 member F-like isoform X2 [Gopherus evgoodei]|uniref:C-type lectin domain family 4 member F-like isoform X2 n=1 Tax=Gopherus evgoodei TaxID=1825980 RepID=UPI0011CFB44B|nr:C-type lectin domain family 4 member F-like isoform X2 [Gopherus evgoodei]
MQTSPSYCRYQNDSMQLSQTKRAKMPHGRPDSMGSFEDDCERDYENIDPNQPPPQPQMQPQWQAKAEPGIPCCPHGWEEFQKKCYFFSLEKEPWEMARNSCNNHSAELAVISNPWEQAFLTVGINSVQHWIGLSHKGAEGSWMWVDGSPVSYISSGIPSVNTQKRCIHLTGDDRGNWSNADCGNRYNFICERAWPFCV